MTNFMGINGIARPENRPALKPTQSGFFDVVRLREFFGMSEYGHYLKGRYFNHVCIVYRREDEARNLGRGNQVG